MAEASGNVVPRELRIRKYPNRRYYDATRSRHLTLIEIHRCVCDGYEIEVIDSRSGTDITGKVLAQILIDLDPLKLAVFPTALLHRLLRANEQLVRDFTQKYFTTALTAFLDSQRKFEQTVRLALGLESGSPATVADWSKLMMGSFSPAQLDGQDLRPVVEDLRRQVKELEGKLTEANQPQKRR